MSSGEVDWEKVRRDVWLKDLLSSSTDEEDVQEPKRANWKRESLTRMKR
jgi:hypothetical protein